MIDLICFVWYLMFSILSLNIRGLNDAQKRHSVFQSFINSKHNIFCIQETHCNVTDIDQWKSEWPGESHWNRGSRKARGVTILIHPKFECETSNLDMDFNGRIISLQIKSEQKTFQLVNIYAPNTEVRELNEYFFSTLDSYLSNEIPNILTGDFNMVENIILDRRGGHPRELHTWGLNELTKLKNEFQLIDIWRHRNPTKTQCTWFSHQHNIQSRLDRFYVTKSLQPYTYAVGISPCSLSDHDGISLDIDLPSETKRGPGYWKFNSELLKDENYKNLIKEFWNTWKTKKDHYSSLRTWWELGKIKIKDKTIRFSIQRKREQREYKNNLIAKINASIDDLEIHKRLKAELKEAELRDARKIYVQTKLDALEHGEKPTKFFFDQLKLKQARNSLTEIYIQDKNGNKITSGKTDDILHETTAYYKELYKAEINLPVEEQSDILGLIDQQIETNQKTDLNQDITKEEIREALWDTENHKSPGWDGLTYEFYKAFWNIFEDDFFQLKTTIFTEGELTVSQKRALISLLHKKGDKKELDNWRPLSLLCTDYKILAKVIANKLKKVMPSIINIDQTCSVPGRSIHSNLHLTRDIITYSNQKRIKGYIVTVDQEKAFDRVDRNLLYKILEKMNLGENLIKWIKILYTKTEACLYVNGHIAEYFTTTRGLKQGCPMSAILYVIFSELFGNHIRTNNNLIGFPLPGTNKQAKITQYADDNTFLLSARTNLRHLHEALNEFERLTGSKFKPSKTKGLCLSTDPPPYNTQFIQWEQNITLLGITFFNDELHTMNYNWTKAIDNLKEHIENTKTRKLAFRGKVLNLNTIGFARFWYLASVFPLPQWLEKTIDKIVFPYLWEGKNEAIKRKTIYLPKLKGGLGLYNPLLRSIALRAKFTAQITNPNCQDKWCLFARYYIGFQLGSLDPSWNFLRSNSNPKPDKDLYPMYYQDILKTIKPLQIDSIQWTTNFLYEKQFLNLDLLAYQLWPRAKNITYDWPSLWQNLHYSLAPAKQQELHFKLVHQALPTRERVTRWAARGGTNPHCESCRIIRKTQMIENHLHLFFNCKNAWKVWVKINPIMQKLLPNKETKIFALTFGVFPTAVDYQTQKMITTLAQITLYEIWLNRNIYTMEKAHADLDASIANIKSLFFKIINIIFQKMKKSNALAKFRKNYCSKNDLVKILANQLVLDF